MTRAVRISVIWAMAISLLGITAAYGSTAIEQSIPDYMTEDEIDPSNAIILTTPSTKAMFVYLVFPGEEPGSDYPGSANSDSVATGLANHLRNNSRGAIDIEGFTVMNPSHPNGWWVADYALSNYISEAAVDGIPGGPRYDIHRGTRLPYLAELQAEAIHKIYNSYIGAGLGNPFVDVGLVIFIYHGDVIHVPGYAYVGGYGFNSVDYTTFSFLDVMSQDFVGSYSGNTLPGCQQENPGKIDSQTGELSFADTIWNLRWVVSHETGHFLGFPHTSGAGYDLSPNWSYLGVYSNMRQVILARTGPVPYHPVYLAEKGWVNEVVVDSSEENFVLGDIRLAGNVVKIPIPGDPYQYFLLSYHGGNGMDVNLGRDGETIYPSRGLAIWHIDPYSWDPYSGIWDLESAWGRYSDPDTISRGSGAWLAENSTSGFDNMDVWVDVSDFSENPEDYGPFVEYFYNNPGSSEDFFGEMSGKTEFSFRSNPNTFGQSGYGRRAAQDLPNSILIRVLQESSDSIVLDILFAPSEEIIFPNGGEALLVGDSYDIAWSNEFTVDKPDGIVGLVDIYFSPGPGLQDIPIAAGVDATLPGVSWTPGPEHVCGTAKIKIVYHNANDATHTGTDESDDYFVVVAPPVAKFTDVSIGTNLNYSGQPTCAIGYDADSDVFKDIFVGIESVQAQSYAFQQTALGSGGVPEFAVNSLFFPQPGARSVVNGDYDNDGDMDLVVTAVGGAKVYRKDGQNYTEVSSTLGLASLTDKATAAVWGDYDNDGWLDLYVVRTGGYTDPPTFPNVFGEQHRLFHNEIALGNGFVDVTAAAGLSGAAIGSVSASFIDFDRDGDLDLFVANLQEPPTGPGGIHSLLYVNQGNGTFAEEYEARFSVESYYATAHKWSDVDNDGDFDLVMTTHESKPEIHFNDGFGGFAFDPVKRLDAAEGHAGLEVFDQDLDGWNDVFCVSKDVANSNRFYSSVETTSGIEFVETTASVGMSIVSQAVGSAATDFTRDGDPDLFLGKSTASGEYFYKTDSQTGGQWIGRDYVKLRLESLYAANNRAGLGAIVEVTDGTNVWIRSVDGGSGRGGQDDRDLVFGLGENAGATTATVRWPNGQVQSGISLTKSNETLGETLNLIADDSPVFVNVSATSVINPVTGKLDWTFYWESHLPGDSSQDVVTFDQVGYPTPCWPGWPNLTPSTPGVVPDYGQLPNGKYFHKLVVSNVDCIRGCGFRFTVSSDVSGTLLTSASKSVTVKFCPAQF